MLSPSSPPTADFRAARAARCSMSFVRRLRSLWAMWMEKSSTKQFCLRCCPAALADSRSRKMARLERSFKTAAIVLRRQDYGEADRLLTIFTPEHGKLRVIAKGVNKPAGRKTGHVELFTRSTMLIRRGREIHVVSQAEMVEPFLPLHEELERGAYANYVAELLDHFTELEEQNTALFRLLDSALGWLAQPNADLRLAARYYELHLLQLVGFQPSLFTCT